MQAVEYFLAVLRLALACHLKILSNGIAVLRRFQLRFLVRSRDRARKLNRNYSSACRSFKLTLCFELSEILKPPRTSRIKKYTQRCEV